MVTSSDASKFIYRDESVPPLTPFEVKVGAYNNKGDGPFSAIVVISSAEGGEYINPEDQLHLLSLSHGPCLAQRGDRYGAESCLLNTVRVLDDGVKACVKTNRIISDSSTLGSEHKSPWLF